MAGADVEVKRQWSNLPNLDSASAKDAFNEFFKQINLIVIDLETLRAVAAADVTLVNEMRANNDLTRTWQTEVDADHELARVWSTEVDADLDAINDYLHFINERDGVVSGDHSFSAGAATTLTATGRVTYRIAGRMYTADVDTTITLVDNGDVTQSTFRAWRILIDAVGTVTTQDAGAGATGLNATDAQDALLSLSQNAVTAGTVEIGYLTLTDSDSVINIGTDNLNASGVTARTFVVTGPRLGCRLTAANGSIVVADAAAATWSVGTIDPRIEGGETPLFSRDLAQISAITNQAMDDADTIADTEFGGWLLVTNLAGTGVYALASDGVAGAVSVLADGSDAGVQTALDAARDALPLIFCPIGEIRVQNASGAGFTAGTTNWDAASVTTLVDDVDFGALDRTDVSGRNVKGEAPAIPATVTAPLVAATITAPVVPAAVAAALSTTAVDTAADMTASKLTTPESGD